MTRQTREWLRSFLRLDARAVADRIPIRDVERQEDTVLRALDLLDGQPGVVIADEVGMGKTFEALGVIAARRRKDPSRRAVIVTPGPTLNTKWVNELTRAHAIHDFSGTFTEARTLPGFLERMREPDARIVVVPVSVFHSTRGGRDQAYILSLYFEWKGLHGHSVNAAFRRFRDGQLERVNVSEERFLGVIDRERLEPHLAAAFRAAGRRDSARERDGLDDLYREDSLDAFASEDVARAIDLAKFRLIRALLPEIDLLVVDEAHKLKNADTVRAQAVTTVFHKKFSKALFLTATPFQLSIGELRQVFAIFAEARTAPEDLLDVTERLFTDIADYTDAYETLQVAWEGLDRAVAEEFRRHWDGDPALERPLPPPQRRLADAIGRLRVLKRDRVEPGLRKWMVRSLREDKRQYRRHEIVECRPDRTSLPFLLYERFIAELFRQREGTHKSSVEINMVSSYGAARKGSLLEEYGRAVPPSAEQYRTVLRKVLDGLRPDPANHPKLARVAQDALSAAERGEKTLVFCTRTETLAELKSALEAAWEERVLERWRRAYPGALKTEIFDDRQEDGVHRGRHARLQIRFQRSQDGLHLALRERALHTRLPIAAWALERVDALLNRANYILGSLRVGQTAAAKLDHGLLQRCVERAAAELMREQAPSAAREHEDVIAALCEPTWVRAGATEDERATSTPAWTIRADAARSILDSRPHLWLHLAPRVTASAAARRDGLIEGIAHYLTRKQVPFLSDVVSFARQEGLDVDAIESHGLVLVVDRFWTSPPGTPWLALLSQFVDDFCARTPEEQDAILVGMSSSADFARHTTDSDSRERLRVAFNTPLHPMVLVANEVMQEGLDLHRNCRRVVHHDLDWNPASLEQRVGRVDRLGSLTARLRTADPATRLDILYPLIDRTIDRRLYRTVRNREKWLEFLLGAPPSFAEFRMEADPPPELPEGLADELRIRLGPQEPPSEPSTGGDEDNTALMGRLLAEGKGDPEIEAVFVARYAALGKSDIAWVRARIRTYKRIAGSTRQVT